MGDRVSYTPLPAPGAADNVMTSDGTAWTSEPGGGGGGAVDSVNGATGVVVLDAGDVGADPAGTTATHAALTTGAHGMSAFGAGLVNDADAAAARVTLGTADEALDIASIVMGAHVAEPDPHTQYHRTFGSATATFANGADSVIVTVVDGGVSAGATIIPSVSMGTRDPDEFEMAPVAVAVGTITAGVGFTLVVTSLDGDAEGDYKINFITSDF